METPTYRAQKGNRSFRVEINSEGIITPPPDTVLEDGKYAIFKGENEIGFFEVKEGGIGKAHSTTPTQGGIRLVIDLSLTLDVPLRSTWAQELERHLAFFEMLTGTFDGKVCPDCGEAHTVNEISRSPQELMKAMEAFVQYLKNDDITALLKSLLLSNEERYEFGYDNADQVQGHLNRVQAALDWQPPAAATAPQQTTTESGEPAADPQPAG